MEFFLQQITSRIDQPVVLFTVFFILAVANLFFPPVPLESATLLGGVLAGTGKGLLLVVISAATSGMFTGSMILFWLTRRYGYAAIQKTSLGRIFAGQSYKKTVEWFDKYGIWSIFAGKFIPGMSLGAVIFSGVFHWKTPRVAVAILSSNLLFFTVLAVTGRLIGANWVIAAGWLKRLNLWSIILAVFLITGIILYTRHRRRNKT